MISDNAQDINIYLKNRKEIDRYWPIIYGNFFSLVMPIESN